MAARITVGLALGSALLLVAALAAVTPAQNRFDLSRAATARSTPAASSSTAGHVNRFATERIRAAAALPPVIGAPTSAAATAARPTATATAAAPPAAAVRSNRFSAPPAATAPAAPPRSEPANDAAPIRIVTSWGGRSIRIAPRAPVNAPVATNRPAAAPTEAGTATDGARQGTGTAGARQAVRSQDDNTEPRLNYWDRRRWDPWYLCGWCYREAPYPSPYVNPRWRYPVPQPVSQD